MCEGDGEEGTAEARPLSLSLLRPTVAPASALKKPPVDSFAGVAAGTDVLAEPIAFKAH